MPEVTIRPETEADVDAILDIVEEVGAEGRWLGVEVPFDRAARGDRIRREFADPSTFAGFVAEDAGRVVGYIDVRTAPYGVATLGMAIIDGYRGLGIGMRLLERVVDWSRAAGAHKLALEVWPHNDRAIALYRKAGFVEEGRLRHQYRRRSGELWDSLLMGLLLVEEPPPASGAG